MTATVSFPGWTSTGNLDHWLAVSTYCDRWCERCRHRTRCLMAGSEPEDLLAMLDAPDTEPLEAEQTAGTFFEDEVVEGLTLTVSAFPRLDDPLLAQARTWSERAKTWLDGRPFEPEAAELQAVLGWYASLVPNKICRALVSQHFLDHCEHCRAAGATDHLGSAKVAALGLHACIGVISRWCKARPLDERALAVLLETCDLLEGLQRRFPDHMGFRRPGFDD